MTVAVDAVVYYRVSNATISITNVEDANRSTRLLAQTTLRNVLGTKNLSEILSDRENISHFMQVYRVSTELCDNTMYTQYSVGTYIVYQMAVCLENYHYGYTEKKLYLSCLLCLCHPLCKTPHCHALSTIHVLYTQLTV